MRRARSAPPELWSIDSVTTWIGVVGGMFQRLRSRPSVRSTASRSSSSGWISWKNAKRPHMSGARRAAGVVLGVGPDDLDTVLRGQAGFRSGVGLGVAVEVAQADVPALVDQILKLGLGLLVGLTYVQGMAQSVLDMTSRHEFVDI